MWECGLKPSELLLSSEVSASLLMWECGLKHLFDNGTISMQESLLMWECGLKRVNNWETNHPCRVTPYVGVWIET